MRASAPTVMDLKPAMTAPPGLWRLALIAGLFGVAAAHAQPQPREDSIVVDAAAGPVARFAARQAFGASLDGGERGEIAPIYTPGNIAKMRSAGLPRISARLGKMANSRSGDQGARPSVGARRPISRFS